MVKITSQVPASEERKGLPFEHHDDTWKTLITDDLTMSEARVPRNKQGSIHMSVQADSFPHRIHVSRALPSELGYTELYRTEYDAYVFRKPDGVPSGRAEVLADPRII